jgi:cell wall-associated NlpC family hydrolase
VSNAAGLAVGGAVAALIAFPVIIAGALGGADGSVPQALSQSLRVETVPTQFRAALQSAGSRCQEAPAPVLAAQLEAESSWNPKAVSPAGAQGMAQFMPGTWTLYGVDGDGDGRADPFNALDAIASQAAYDCALAANLRSGVASGQIQGGLTELMLAAYNAGPQAVRRYAGIPPYDETSGYVQKIMARATFYGTAPALADGAAFGARVVAAARTQLGVPYAWGGGSATGPTRGVARGAGTIGWDCSGLVIYAVAQASGGQTLLPHFADTQTRAGTPVPDPAQLQPGDLISFTRRGETVAHHIGIYVGDGQMIHAPETGSVVSVSSLSTAYWKGQTWRAVRIG